MKLLLAVLTFVLPITAQARPVSYPEAWTAMFMNDKGSNSSHIHYSPTARYSVGWLHEYMREPGMNSDFVQFNYLIKRHNTKTSQANLYLKSGIGVTYDSNDFNPAAFTGFAADWETQRYFTSYENRFLSDTNEVSFARHTARVGIAPYIGNYGDLHTWVMLETEYEPDAKDDFSVTPLFRFFKGPNLVEAGYNLDNGILFNYVRRF